MQFIKVVAICLPLATIFHMVYGNFHMGAYWEFLVHGEACMVYNMGGGELPIFFKKLHIVKNFYMGLYRVLF